MPVQSIFETKKQKTQYAIDAYHRLRTTLDSLEEPPATEVIDEILFAAGKTWDDLQRDVQVHQRREGLKLQLAAMQVAKDRKAKLVAEITAKNEKFEELRKKHEAELFPLRVAIQECSDAVLFEYDTTKQLNALRWNDFDTELESLRVAADQAAQVFNIAQRTVSKCDADLYTASAGGEKIREEHNLAPVAVLKKRLSDAKSELKEASATALQARQAYETRLAEVNAM